MKVSFQSNKEEVERALRDQTDKALTRAAMLAQKYARENAPVGTGQLRNSIDFQVEETEAIIGTNLEYAPYVELGTGIYATEGTGRQTAWSYQDAAGEWHKTVGQKPQPYLLPAIENHAEEYEGLFQEILGR